MRKQRVLEALPPSKKREGKTPLRNQALLLQGDKPLIVLTSGKTLGATPISGLDERGVSQFERMWVQDLQPRLARLSIRGKQVILPDTGHNIPGEQPEAIVSAVREICTIVAEH